MFKLLKFGSSESARGNAARRDMDAPACAQTDDAVARLMRRIDYYLHCELDAEYQHDDPHDARERLIEALRAEFAARNAQGTRDLAPADRTSVAPNDPLCA